MDIIIYGPDGLFMCIQRTNFNGTQTCFGPGSNLWDDYVAKNGTPQPTGTPTNKPGRIPNAYTSMFAALVALPQAKQLQVMGSVCCLVLVNNPQLAAQINAAFSLNLPFDQPNP